MRTELDHLPAVKQRELDRVLQILFQEFDDAIGRPTKEWKKKGRILKVILYGSHGRGGWVDEPHTAKGYVSDFDILIIVSDQRLTDRVQYWARAEETLNREYAITQNLKTPVNFIVHTLHEVNDALSQGRFFFMDVAKDGIALYQSDTRDLAEPKPKTPEQALKMAKAYFDEWFPSAIKRFDGAKFHMGKGNLKDAAFDLHQTAERLCHCVLLVCSFHSPHSHNLGFLRTQAERQDRRLTNIWPTGSRKERAMFEKLKAAYIQARYSKHYRISAEDLNWLCERVEQLVRLVQVICVERIDDLARDVAKNASANS